MRIAARVAMLYSSDFDEGKDSLSEQPEITSTSIESSTGLPLTSSKKRIARSSIASSSRPYSASVYLGGGDFQASC